MAEDSRAMPADPAAAQQVRDNQIKTARVIAQAMADGAFRERLRGDPAEVLSENGVDLQGWKVEVVGQMPANSVDFDRKTVYIHVPDAPSAQLSDAQLAGVAGGGSCAGSASTIGCAITCIGSNGTASTMC